MISRRTLLLSTAVAGAAGLLAMRFSMAQEGTPEVFEITKTDDEWRALLTEDQYRVLRHEGTEYPFTSPLLDEHRVGTFNCAGCDLPVYPSETKYDSGTGWPSFWQEIPDAIRTKTDVVLIVPRTECHCRRCGGHMGHIFNDGPAPTGLRHCINGVSLNFVPAA